MTLQTSIAIIELYQHHEVLRHYCGLLKGSDHKVKIFCSSMVHQMLEDLHDQPSFEWVVSTKNESIPSSLSSNYSLIKEAKLVFITTALNNFKAFYQLSKINKTILLVHNAQSFLAPQASLSPNLDLSDRLRWLKIQLNRSHYYKKQLLKSLVGLVFPTEIVLEYIQDRFKIPTHLKLAALPFVSYEQQTTSSTDRVIITVPCTVTSVLRDYELVLSSLKKIKDKLTKDIHLILLGKPKGDGSKIIADFQKLDSPTIKVTTFHETISVKTYEHWLKVSHFLILPLRQYGKNYIYQEQLGYTKISGGINDMIRFGIPALVPAYYPLSQELENLVEKYDEGELPNKILTWVHKPENKSTPNQIASILMNHTSKQMRNSFLEKIDIFYNL